MSQRLLMAVLMLVNPTEVEVGVGLTGLVTEFFEEAQSLPEVDVGFVIATEPAVGAADTSVSVGLCTLVSLSECDGQGAMHGGGQVVPMPVPFKELHKHAGKLPGMGVMPSSSGKVDGGD
jgi:hypothetical protein